MGGAGAHAVDGHQGRAMLAAAPWLAGSSSLLGGDACAGPGEGVGNVGACRVAVLKCRAGDRHAGQGGASCLHGFSG